jgi:hypothetical protein
VAGAASLTSQSATMATLVAFNATKVAMVAKQAGESDQQ